MDRCTQCKREMRPHGGTITDYPGGITRATSALCITCYRHRGGKPQTVTAPPDDDPPCVLVRSDLRMSTYKAFDIAARERGVTVGELLSDLADRVVHRRSRPRGSSEEIDQRIRELNAQQFSDNRIAKSIGLAQSAVSTRRKRLGLEPPTPRRGGRQPKASSPVGDAA